MKKSFAVLIALFLLLMPFQANAASTDDMRPIAIQGAMDMEVAYFLKQMDTYKTETFGAYTYYSGSIDGISVVISRTNVGMVNAAASTMLLIEKYHPKAIINQGTAGGHDPGLHKFDIVVGEKVINYGMYQSSHKDEGAGINTGDWKVSTTEVREDGEIKEFLGFKPDPEMYAAAMSVAGEYTHGKVVSGVIGSADGWNKEIDRILQLHNTIGTSVEEMETASVAQVAESFHVPFLGIRILSNSELHNENFDPKSAAYCSEFVIQVVKEIVKQVSFSDELQIYVNEKKVDGVRGQLVNGKVMIPLRAVMENLGAEVKWNSAKRQINVTYGGKPYSVESSQYVILTAGTAWMDLDSLQLAFKLQGDRIGSSVYLHQ